jgi:tRNA(fMet)-specific endonuclease VapC
VEVSKPVRAILIDTNAYTAFMRGEARMVEVITHAPQLFVSSTVLGELLAGFAAGTREAKNRSELSQFLNSPRVGLYPVTADTADSYAQVYASLRRKRLPIPSNDLWIAASALEHGAALLSLDAHFANVDGLRLGQCLNDFLP